MNDLLLVLNASKRERRLKIEEKKQKQAEAEKGTRQKRGRSDSSEFAPLASCGAIAVVKDSSLTKRSRGTCRRKHSKSTPVSFFHALFSRTLFHERLFCTQLTCDMRLRMHTKNGTGHLWLFPFVYSALMQGCIDARHLLNCCDNSRTIFGCLAETSFASPMSTPRS